MRVEGDLDFRGTLGVDKEAPVGFKSIRLAFDIETDAPYDAIARAPKADRALLCGVSDAEQTPRFASDRQQAWSN